MAHYAKVLDGKVIDVIRASQDFIDNFVDNTPGTWIKTSYNTHGGVHYDPSTGEPSADQTKALRYNYAGIGYTYDASADAFIPPKVFESMVLNTTTYQWDFPVAYPTDGQKYNWNEETQTWDAVETE